MVVEVSLTGASVAETSSKNTNHGLKILLADGGQVELAAANRAELQSWLNHLRRAAVPGETLSEDNGHHW